MKKLVAGLSVLAVVTLMTGADILTVEETTPSIVVNKKPCYGYTIIEFGMGLDCNGDTIRLVKVSGGQERWNPESPAFADIASN